MPLTFSSSQNSFRDCVGSGYQNTQCETILPGRIRVHNADCWMDYGMLRQKGFGIVNKHGVQFPRKIARTLKGGC